MSLFYSLLEPEAVDVLTLILTRLPSCIRGVARALCRGWRDAVQCRGLRVCVTSPVKFIWWCSPQRVCSENLTESVRAAGPMLDYFGAKLVSAKYSSALLKKIRCQDGWCDFLARRIICDHTMRKHRQEIFRGIVALRGGLEQGEWTGNAQLSPGYYALFLEQYQDWPEPRGETIRRRLDHTNFLEYHLRHDGDSRVAAILAEYDTDLMCEPYLADIMQTTRRHLLLVRHCIREDYNVDWSCVDQCEGFHNIPLAHKEEVLALARDQSPELWALLISQGSYRVI